MPRPIHIAKLDKSRPVVVLTREEVRDLRDQVTVAPITTTARGLATEVAVGTSNSLGHDSVILCDDIQTIDTDDLGELVGYLSDEQERHLAEAIIIAFDLTMDEA